MNQQPVYPPLSHRYCLWTHLCIDYVDRHSSLCVTRAFKPLRP